MITNGNNNAIIIRVEPQSRTIRHQNGLKNREKTNFRRTVSIFGVRV